MNDLDSFITYFYPQPTQSEAPDEVLDPFGYEVHPIAIRASEILQSTLEEQISFDNDGQFFGVLVVRDGLGKIGYLSAFSGKMFDEWIVPGFVPPVSPNNEHGYVFCNALNEEKSVLDLWCGEILFDGVGDCVSPKLLQYANKNNLIPLAFAEFWWGKPTKQSVRHHG